MSDEEDFLSRWSRRKRRVAEEVAPPELEPSEAVAPETGPGTDDEPATEEEETALLQRLGLPKPESLGPGDDFRAFMAQGVPHFLRRRALRVLWRSNPVLANLDGLNDYDADFNSPELTKKIIATGYQVGRGFVSRVVEASESRAADRPVEVAEAEIADAEGEIPDETPEPEIDTVPEPDEEAVPRPRRMRFET